MFDLDHDTRRFFARMALDIGALAGSAARPVDAEAIVHTLLEALMVPVAAKPAAWQRLYHAIGLLTAGYPIDAVTPDECAEVIAALGRMRQFLRENADIADATLTITNAAFARTLRGRVGA
jgi:hypothetical protein